MIFIFGSARRSMRAHICLSVNPCGKSFSEALNLHLSCSDLQALHSKLFTKSSLQFIVSGKQSLKIFCLVVNGALHHFRD